MPVTLAQAKNAAQDDIQSGVIDEYRKSSYLLDTMTFDDAVSPGTSGGTLTYGYARLVTQPNASTRAFNAEYVPAEVTTQRYTVELKPFGGSFEIDRVLANVNGLYDHVALQMEQKIKAARSLFHDLVINGDSGSDATEFDGLDVALAGSTTEITAGVDWTGINSQATAFAAMEAVDELIAMVDGRPDAIMGNKRALARLRAMGRYAGYLSQSEDAFGRVIDAFDGIPLIDLGDKPGTNDAVVPIVTATGLTDLYAVRFGLDGFHAVSMANQPLVRTWLPDFSVAGAVKKGEVEMVAAVALKATKAAAVLRDVKVQAANP
jgi:hypothetical protein